MPVLGAAVASKISSAVLSMVLLMLQIAFHHLRKDSVLLPDTWKTKLQVLAHLILSSSQFIVMAQNTRHSLPHSENCCSVHGCSKPSVGHLSLLISLNVLEHMYHGLIHNSM